MTHLRSDVCSDGFLQPFHSFPQGVCYFAGYFEAGPTDLRLGVGWYQRAERGNGHGLGGVELGTADEPNELTHPRRIETYRGMSALRLLQLGVVFFLGYFLAIGLGILLYSVDPTGPMSFGLRLVIAVGVVDSIAMCVVFVLIPAAHKREQALGYTTAPGVDLFPLVDSRTGVVVREVGEPTLSRKERNAVIEQYLQQSSETGSEELK